MVRNLVRPVVRLLNVAEVAETLGVSKATVYGMIERGNLERVWMGTAIRVPLDSLSAFIAARRK